MAWAYVMESKKKDISIKYDWYMLNNKANDDEVIIEDVMEE